MCGATSVFSYLLDRRLNSAVHKAIAGSTGGGSSILVVRVMVVVLVMVIVKGFRGGASTVTAV
jgi:hypothetical protein